MHSTIRFVTPSWRRTLAALCTLLTAVALTGLTALPAHAAAQTFAYITNYDSDSVSVIDTATNTVTATIAVGGHPAGAAVSLDGTRVYVANANVGSGSVSVVDTATNAVTATIAVGVNPRGATISPDGTRLYVTNTGSGSVSVIDTATNTVTATIAVNRPGGVGVTPDGTRAYVTNSNLDTVSVIDTATNTVTETMTGLGLWPFAVVFVEVGTATSADIDVNLGAQPRLGLLVPYLTYTLTARNTGPGAVTSATLTATLPPGKKATNLAAGCVTTPGTVTCTYGAIAGGASVGKTFRVPLRLLSLGKVKVTGARTTSAPADPNPANDHDGATCTVISFLLVTCR
ncbi:beta-propeller fold lactonase family protein [Streptosporangium lutulentum]|uniref:YVTN family beta-propeller protein n=1 Tax=Streptosporangium lutulentum TaxID=1461250 RepID=A0ABT9QS85_9ACTN|nr:beta-propeller fold lactonase family protein [Streptosporangium lutulentum]MDP9849276.1 YVTN family beta-propeller protein [Streptosporangium lutulentum]